MSLSEESSSQASAQSGLNASEARIASAVVAALQPQFAAILERLDGLDKRLDGVDKRLATLNALVVANHEDIMWVKDKLADFHEENEQAWATNSAVMNQLVKDMTYLMDR